MRIAFPPTASELLNRGEQFWSTIRKLKAETKTASFDWYPFESLSALPVVAELLEPVFPEIHGAVTSHPVLDIGCADGDFAVFLASCGLDVDAVDHAASNFNRMAGVESLARSFKLDVGISDLDLDARFEFPRTGYGLTLFLGTLYHLKNPYYLLETLAYQSRWCLLSTRIAQVTPRAGARIENEPLAYLADGREINNDATNYWIFSASGLLRILQRTRWAIRGVKRIGCRTDSNPVQPDADERMFVLVQSRVYYPELQVRVVEGCYESRAMDSAGPRNDSP